MDALIARWLSGSEEQITLFEGNDEIILRRHEGTLLLHVQLTLHRPAPWSLEIWMSQGWASLSHFRGSLALAPATGALWLVQCLQNGTDEKRLLDCLEAILNQRDTWRAMFARLTRPTQKFTPTSLRSLPH